MRRILLLFLCSLLLRLAAVLQIGEYRRPNVWESGMIADALVAGRGFAFNWHLGQLSSRAEPATASTWYPPVYPLFLAACHIVSPRYRYLIASLVQAALSAGLPVLILLMGRRLFGHRAGWLGALVAAVHPPFLGFPALIQTALFDIFWTTAGLFFALRASAVHDGQGAAGAGESHPSRDAFFAGISIAMAGLTRGPALALLGFAPVAWASARVPLRRVLRQTGVLLLGAALLVGPWTARNYHLRGAWVFSNSKWGWNLYIGNNPAGTADVPDLRRAVPPELASHLMTMNEVEGDRYLRRLALEYIRTHPRETALRVLARARNLVWFNKDFGVSSGYSSFFGRGTRFAYKLTWALLLPLGIVGMVLARRAWRSHVLLYGTIAANAVVILATAFTNRYRAPIEPVLILFAGLALDRGVGLLSRRRTSAAQHAS